MNIKTQDKSRVKESDIASKRKSHAFHHPISQQRTRHTLPDDTAWLLSLLPQKIPASWTSSGDRIYRYRMDRLFIRIWLPAAQTMDVRDGHAVGTTPRASYRTP